MNFFGTELADRLKFLCEVYSFSTSPKSRQRTTVLNADVPQIDELALLRNPTYVTASRFLVGRGIHPLKAMSMTHLPLPFLSVLSLPLHFPPIHFPSLRSRTPSIQLGSLGSAVSFPIGVWGGAPADIEVGAF